jgi:hypothetical protein
VSYSKRSSATLASDRRTLETHWPPHDKASAPSHPKNKTRGKNKNYPNVLRFCHTLSGHGREQGTEHPFLLLVLEDLVHIPATRIRRLSLSVASHKVHSTSNFKSKKQVQVNT